MRIVAVATLAVVVLAGCNVPVVPLELQVDSYHTITSLDRREADGSRLRITCDGGPVHVLAVSLDGFPNENLERERWRLGWSDGSTTVVVYAEDRALADGRQADLYACSITSPRIVQVALRDVNGEDVAVGDVDEPPTSG